MSIRRALGGNGVVVVSARQVAELVNAERLRRGISHIQFGALTGLSDNALHHVMTNGGKQTILGTILAWLPPLDCKITLGGQDAQSTQHVCRILNERRIELGYPANRVQCEGTYSWPRIQLLATGSRAVSTPKGISLNSVLAAVTYLDLEMRLCTIPITSKRVKRYLALGVAPEHATKASGS